MEYLHNLSNEVGGKSRGLLIEFHSTTLLPSNTENPAGSPVLLSDGLVRINCQTCVTGNFLLLWCNRESRQKSDTWLHRGKTESVSEERAFSGTERDDAPEQLNGTW